MAAIEGFAAVPNWLIRRPETTIYHVAVYAALASHTGPGGIHPSQATIAAEAHCSERQVRSALADLDAIGRATNGYVLHPHGRLADDEESMEVAAHDAGTSEVAAQSFEVAAHSAGGSGTQVQSRPLIEEEPIKKNPLEEVGPRKRGERIPEPFFLTSKMRAWAADEVPGLDVDAHTREFVDHWRAASGQNAVKRDWVAAWRNWMRKAHRWAPASRGQKRQDEALGLLARALEEERNVEVGRNQAADLRIGGGSAGSQRAIGGRVA
jgi:hypothetical protein